MALFLHRGRQVGQTLMQGEKLNTAQTFALQGRKEQEFELVVQTWVCLFFRALDGEREA